LKIDSRSSLADVAVAVGDALRRAGIRAVLTGGACASLYSGGAYESMDADFILSGSPPLKDLNDALNELGFRRRGDRYVHPRVPFFVEFPRGPLGIGQDVRIRAVWCSRRGAKTLALSATDSCRDRLAAYYHWRDLQSLAAAVAIASRNRVALRKIREWSRREGHSEGYRAFLAEVERSRKSGRRVSRSPG
jgi:hypothetical protein